MIDLKSITYLIIIMGVFLAPVTIFMSQFAFFVSLKRDKTEMQHVASQLHQSIFSLVMALLMRSPERPGSRPSGGSMPPESEFVDYTNSDFYSNNWQPMYQVPVLENFRRKTKQSTILSGILSGILIFLIIFLTLLILL